ncbi:hypothetical protein DUZ99_11965 [Xylanibacillus composti]|uniref:Uncharacterized protein n=1 Tax=Xylanibacillus composti TaxID=1572762 RepID=A0A8J4H7C3_9BACL|nr:hypothetical protein [Xylanibacillus composti]MDT9725689.1 hypothetical protein [Xylanibacillus composti]GIQ71170.1 hypothetical protein XYCOK13_39940 [Xylanibacillus composti]
MLLGRLLLFTLTSSVSYIGTLFIILVCSAFSYRQYVPHIVFVCLSLSYLSFTTRAASLELYSPFIQMAFLVVLLWLLFRFHFFHAFIMGVTGIICFGVLDPGVAFFFMLAGYEVVQFSVQMHVVGVLSGLLGLAVSAIISKKNWGFSFIREEERVKVNLRERNSLLLVSAIGLGIIGLFAGYFFVLYINNPTSVLFTVIVALVSTVLLLYLSGERERQEYESKRRKFWIGK